MTWREELARVRIVIDGQPRDLIGASFRGVPFLVDEAQRTGGRRTVTHEFPFRDAPFTEDLGRGRRDFPITGYVIGNDYLAAKNALLAALEDVEGSGELLHPYYGARRCICPKVTVTEKRIEGGIATFAIEFIETPAQAVTPSIALDSPGRLATSATAAKKATKAELAEKFSAAGLPAFALASAELAIAGAAAALSAQLAPAVSATQELATLTGQLAVITARASSLARQPGDAFDGFDSAIGGLIDTAEASPGAVLDALVDAYGVDLGPAPLETTATRRREAANQAALTGALRRLFAIEAARLAPRVPFASIEDATAARDRLAGQLEEQAAGAGDTAYPALVDLRSQLLRAVPGGAAFARIITVSRRVALPSLLLAYQLYGSVDREADILARNKVRHPGFIAGDLKVLSG